MQAVYKQRRYREHLWIKLILGGWSEDHKQMQEAAQTQ